MGPQGVVLFKRTGMTIVYFQRVSLAGRGIWGLRVKGRQFLNKTWAPAERCPSGVAPPAGLVSADRWSRPGWEPADSLAGTPFLVEMSSPGPPHPSHEGHQGPAPAPGPPAWRSVVGAWAGLAAATCPLRGGRSAHLGASPCRRREGGHGSDAPFSPRRTAGSASARRSAACPRAASASWACAW